jgi:AraC-like DNA-binding protein
MSRRTLQRAIADRGFTYSQLLSESRLRRAVQWLDHTNKPINEIARELGYTDAANFSRAFRRRTGLSPSDFRDGVKRT